MIPSCVNTLIFLGLFVCVRIHPSAKLVNVQARACNSISIYCIHLDTRMRLHCKRQAQWQERRALPALVGIVTETPGCIALRCDTHNEAHALDAHLLQNVPDGCVLAAVIWQSQGAVRVHSIKALLLLNNYTPRYTTQGSVTCPAQNKWQPSLGPSCVV